MKSPRWSNGRCRWPAGFEERFLALPRELLISVLQDHQRYFPVDGRRMARLLPWFITVSNVDSTDIAVVRAGNERVVRPRLTDAAFFWEQDRKSPLAARRPQLDAVTFQAQLGSIGDKVRRITQLAREIAARIDGDARTRRARRAARQVRPRSPTWWASSRNCRASWAATTPAADGEPAEVATAIAEHYQPRGAGDALPTTKSGLAVALADRLDTSPASSPSARSPAARRTPSRCGVRPSASAACCTSIACRWTWSS